jgi:hypothetical protein
MTQNINKALILKMVIFFALIINQMIQFFTTLFYSPTGFNFRFIFVMPYLLHWTVLFLMLFNFKKYKMIIGIIFGCMAILGILNLVLFLVQTNNGNFVIQPQLIINLLSNITFVLSTIWISGYLLSGFLRFKSYMIGLIILYVVMFIFNFLNMRTFFIQFVYSFSMFDGLAVARSMLNLVYGPLFLIFMYYTAKPNDEKIEMNVNK